METSKATIVDAAVMAVYGGLCYALGFMGANANQMAALSLGTVSILAPFLMLVILWAHARFGKKKEEVVA